MKMAAFRGIFRRLPFASEEGGGQWEAQRRFHAYLALT